MASISAWSLSEGMGGVELVTGDGGRGADDEVVVGDGVGVADGVGALEGTGAATETVPRASPSSTVRR
jgi:hypothetical protein